MGSPLQCGLVRFETIYKDLKRFPLPSHDRIAIVQAPDGYYPTTKPRGQFPSSIDLKSAEFALCYFEANLVHLSQVTNASEFFFKFTPVFCGKPLAARFSKICERIFQGEMLENLEPIRKKMIEDMKIECENEVKSLKLEIADLQMKKDELKNTLFVCQHGEKIHAHFNTLKKIQFFEGYSHSGMEKVVALNLSEEDKKKYPNIFDFSDFASKTLLQFLFWVKDSDSIKTCHVFEELCELYRLSDYLCDDPFQVSCLEHLNKSLDDEKILLLLSEEKFPASDRLIQQCCQSVAKKFKSLAFENSFLKIKHEYLIEILKNDTIPCNEILIFKAVLKWAQARPKDILYAKIDGKTLIDCIRFQFIDPTDFLSVKDRLTEQDREKWYEFYLQNKVVSQVRRTLIGLNFYAEGKQIKVEWMIPIKDYKNLKASGEIISENFSFNKTNYLIGLGALTDRLLFTVFGHDIKFKYFLQLDAFQGVGVGRSGKELAIPYNSVKSIDLNKESVLLKCLIFLE